MVLGPIETSSTGDDNHIVQHSSTYNLLDHVCRSGIEKNTGTHWLRIEQPKENKVVFKQVEVESDMLVATDKDNNVFYKIGFNKDLKGKLDKKLLNQLKIYSQSR